MSHVDDGQLNALLDGELDDAERREVESHLSGCPACRARLADARRFLDETNVLLGALEPPTRNAEPPALPGSPVVPAPTRRVSTTAKEVAIDLDGATGKSPAIRLPPAPGERAPGPPAPPVARPRRAWPVREIAWAASIVVTFSVGYLARGLRRPPERNASTAAPSAGAVPAPAHRGPVAGPDTGRRERGGARAAPADHHTGGAAADAAAGAGNRPAVGGEAKPANGAPSPALDATSMNGISRRLAAQPPPPAPAAVAPPATTAAGELSSEASAGRGAQLAAGPEASPRQPSARTHAAAPSAAGGFVRVPLDTAVAHLSGSVRLIDGMDPARVEIGPANLVSGAAAGLDVVRLIYVGPRGVRIVLDQQRLPTASVADQSGGQGVGLLYGDTLVTTSGATTRIRWLTAKNFWVSLSAAMEPDSLRALLDRVH